MSNRLLPVLGIALLLLAAGLISAGPAAAADTSLGFDAALAQAKERGVPVLVDFFTDWCVYCKHFDKDLAREESGLHDELGAVVFTSVDAEKGDGVDLAKKYGVSSYPTYLLVDAEGEAINRWSGYGGPEYFLNFFRPAMADPTTLSQKQARFDSHPTAKDAQTLAKFAAGALDQPRARALYRQAEALDTELDLSQDILYSGYQQWRKDDAFGGRDFVDLVGETLSPQDDSGSWLLALNLASRVSQKEESQELTSEVLRGALAAQQAQPDFDEGAATRLKVLSLLHLEDKGEEAAQLEKTTMKEGWQDDADALNSYAWWCFENRVNLSEAEQLARRGVELAESGSQKAMILDTAAEICNALGNCRDSVALIEQALAEDPDNEGYQKQLARFQKLLAESR